MRKILFILLIISIHSFALTLDQVRADLKKNSISGDSIEINVRTSVSTAGSKQSVSVLKLVVENVGNTVVNGFEARYYFRDVSGKMAISVYDKVDANVEMVNAGGNLY
ncbi:hypothetical protein [Fibrobacter intestinalis]|uniref:Uncharacterized protein n=1 Tax=Fibrobacter intestinalis TaxID=28122 RepID=A0A1T4RJV2_9BACT|nr:MULTISPECIES: hypothetical protein [Fibrobacter]PBC74485.1 hypothetical protein BGW94_2138 [Fibrobacter sp. NR9]SKA16255.1 hypothetical protein SAMN02745108_02756 [Fibrobacter intestinalis]